VLAAGIGALALSRLHWREPAARQALAPSSSGASVAVDAPKAPPAIIPEHAVVPQHTVVPEQALAPEQARIEVEKAREAELQQQVQRTASGARVAQAQVYVQLARKRLTAGALLEPSDDSARAYVTAAVALAPEDAEVRAVSAALRDALSAAFTGAIAAGDATAAKLWLQACSEQAAGSPMLSRFKLQLDALESSQRAQAEQLAGMQSDLGQLPAEAQARVAPDLNGAQPSIRNALETAVAGDQSSASDVVPEGRLQRQHFVPPTYPPAALAGGVTGFVELQFTVDASGKVSDIQVQAAEPRGVFERAAISALSQSRYHPVLRDGLPITQRAQIRLRFTQ
jgi:TonB family protein